MTREMFYISGVAAAHGMFFCSNARVARAHITPGLGAWIAVQHPRQ